MPGNWQYKYMCMWEYLEEEAVDHPNSEAAEWCKDMLDAYGDITNFPHIGCGANFVPFACGPSLVCEIQFTHKDGAWEAFLADQVPSALDDQIKKVNYQNMTRCFSKISPEVLLQAIPMTMPMTYLATVDGKEMKGIAKYPLDQWLDEEAPCFTREKWAMICLLIAER